MSKRKSCRPWMSSVGVLIDDSAETGERVEAKAAAAVRSVLTASPVEAARSCGSHRLVGTSPARNCTRPDFDSPRGASEVRRFVQVMTGTIALNGIPATAAFQTAPPPSEMPSAPICVSEISGRAVNQAKSSRVSCTSRGPSSPKTPSDVPWPRASQASAAYPAGARNCVASGSMSSCRPPSPWKSITAGQPAVGGAPSGSVSEHASFAPSDAGIVSCCGVAAPAVAAQRSNAVSDATKTTGRAKTGVRVSLLYDHRMDARPIGVFDSGVGGLTVLHECLVTMPHEDFVYLGDHARLPYGPRPLDEVRAFAREIGLYLEAQDVKLIVVACNTATSAALPQLQELLTVPVIAVLTPEVHAAVQATRNRRIGLLATQGTVESGRYAELVRSLDAGVAFHAIACPRLVPLIESDDPYGEQTEDAVREYAAALKEADVDTVILGCTHYPLIRPIFQRVFGRDVTLVFSAEETARDVSETLARKAIETDTGREGAYRFLTTGDPAAFREMGRRFLQLPITEVERVTIAQLEGAAA